MLLSSLYRAAHITSLACTDNEKLILANIFQIRLHASARHSTRFGYTTQRNEAFNRSLSKNLPKNILFSRNNVGRVSSAVHQINHGRATSVRTKLAASGVPLSSKRGGGYHRLLRHHRQIVYNKAYQKTVEYKQLRAATRMQSSEDWYKRKVKRGIRNDGPDYKKGQRDPYQMSA